MDYSNMPLEEKRLYYECGNDYVTLDQVQPWPDYVKKSHQFFTRKGWLQKDSEFTTDNDHINRKVSFWQGDITRLEIDAIVNYAGDGRLEAYSDIHRAAGKGLWEEYRKLNRCDIGEAEITSGQKLPAKHVIHTRTPGFGKQRLLERCYNSCLRLVKEYELSSVAFCCLSARTHLGYEYTSEEDVDVALKTVKTWLEENDDWVGRIIFCIFSQENLDTYQRLMLEYFPCTTKNGTEETEDIEEEEYSRAYSQALHEGEAKNNRIPIMVVGQDRGGKTSLMRRLLGLLFNKDQPSTTGIDVNVIELTEQNAEDPWKKTEVKKFMTSESEAKTVLYKKTAEYFDGGVQRNLEGDAPEPLQPVMQVKPVMPVKPEMPVKPLLREEISEIKSQRSTEHDQDEVLRVFVSDFAGQSIYYDTHGCFVKPHCPYVLVYDLSLEFDKPAVPRFKANDEEEEIEMNNPHLNTNLDNFTSWLKFLQGLGECQDQQFTDKSGHFTTAKGENFKLPPVLIALTHSDEVKGNDSKIDCVQKRINKVLSGGKYENVAPEFFVIDNTLEGDDGDDVRKLRRKLFDLSNAVLNQEILMPVKWLNFEVALSRKDFKYIPVDEAKQEAKVCGVGEFDQAIKFLHRQGVVVHHSGSSKVVLDPHWLMNRFTKVISMPGKLDALSRHALDLFKQKGILFREYLETLEDAELLEELMQKFNLICLCQHEGKAAFYVPSVAPAMKPGKESEASNVPSLFVTFPHCFHHSKIKVIYSRRRVISSIYELLKTSRNISEIFFVMSLL